MFWRAIKRAKQLLISFKIFNTSRKISDFTITSFLNKVRGEKFFRDSHDDFIYILTRRDIEVHIENMCFQIGNLKLEPYD